MSEPTETDPYARLLDVQRRAVEEGRRLAHRGVDIQQQSMRTATEGMESQQSLQRKTTDAMRTATEAYLDAVEASVPMGAPMFEGMHAFVRGQFEATDELGDWTWGAFRAGVEDGSEIYADLLDEYLVLVDDSAEAYTRTLDGMDPRGPDRFGQPDGVGDD